MGTAKGGGKEGRRSKALRRWKTIPTGRRKGKRIR